MKPYLRRRFTQDLKEPAPKTAKTLVSRERPDGSMEVVEDEREVGGIYEPFPRYAFPSPVFADDIAELLAGIEKHARAILRSEDYKPDDPIVAEARIVLSLKSQVKSALQKARPGRPFPPLPASEKGVRYDPILEGVMVAFQLGQFVERLHVRPFDVAARRGRRSEAGTKKLTENKRRHAAERAEIIRNLAAEPDINGERYVDAKGEAIIAHVQDLWRRKYRRPLPSPATIRRALKT